MAVALKNPFGEKGGKLILISDVPPNEDGKKCGCICPLCKGSFQAKINGKIRQAHFAHMGKPCNETIAFMISLYKFFEQHIEERGSFCPPAVYANFNGVGAEERATIETIRSCTSFSTVQLEDAETVLKSKRFEVSSCEIVCGKEMPEALVLTAKDTTKKLAVIVVPPATICKNQRKPQAFENLPTVAIYIDRTVDFYKLHSDQLQKKIDDLNFPTEWVFNKKLAGYEEAWLKRKWKEHQKEYEELEKKKQENRCKMDAEQSEPVVRKQNLSTERKTRWHICEICHQRKPEDELVYYQNDSEDGAICRECSRKREKEHEMFWENNGRDL